MKHKTQFRLMLKLVGVWLVVSGAAEIVTYASYVLYGFATRTGGMSYTWFRILAPLLQVGAGLYLFIDGRWVADKAIPGNRPYCHECGYDLTGAVGNICNECGTPFKAPDARMQD